MGKSDGKKRRNIDLFEKLDRYHRDCWAWKNGGRKGPSPAQPNVSFSVYDEWTKSVSARYRRHTALHEGGHAVVAEILLPHSVKEVQLGNLSPLSEDLQEIVRQGTGDLVDGQVLYEDLPISDDDAQDVLLKRIVRTLGGMAFQSMEGYEAVDEEVTEATEVRLVGATLEQFEQDFGISADTQDQILVRSERIIADLQRDGGVRKAVTAVADKLMVSSPISGSDVRKIVEANCCSELLERMQARL
jgi:hypothetical protein